MRYDAHDLQTFLDEHDDAQLLDVRQPFEYREGHLPGARLVPMTQLHAEMDSLDPALPTVVYCHAGIRSTAAVRALRQHGFDPVLELRGGLLAWDGLVVDGLPDAGLAWFSEARSLRDLIVQARSMEEGARVFYNRAAELAEGGTRVLFADLGTDEIHHKASLANLHQQLTGEPISEELPAEHMEGGARVDQVLAWMERHGSREHIELAMALETTAYDRYVQLARMSQDDATRTVFQVLADSERRHLERLTQAFEVFDR